MHLRIFVDSFDCAHNVILHIYRLYSPLELDNIFVDFSIHAHPTWSPTIGKDSPLQFMELLPISEALAMQPVKRYMHQQSCRYDKNDDREMYV